MHMGASLDREDNKKWGLREISPFFLELKNVTLYSGSNPLTSLINIFTPNP